MKWFSLALIAATLTVPQAFAADQLQQFGYSTPIEFTPGDALYVLRLPESVYRHVARPDLADVRVFNSAGETVAYALRRPEVVSAEATPLKPLPLFPIARQQQSNSDSAMDVEVRSDGTVVRVRPARTAGAASNQPKTTTYLLDASRLDTDIKGLQVEFDSKAANIVARVMVEGSDDLKRWDTWVSEAPLLQTEFNGQRLQQLTIEFSARRAKYLRIESIGEALQYPMMSITPIGASSLIEAPRTTTTVKAMPDKEAGVFLYELGAMLPLDKVSVRLTENNAVSRFELETRADEKSPWQHVSSGVAFRLLQNGQTLRSPAFPVATYSARALRLRTTPASNVAPELELSWVPHELVFAARGSPPFTLAYGRAGAESAALPIESLIPGYGTATAFTPRVATLGNEAAVSGASALKASPAYGKYGLWAILVLGAAILGYMGMRLAKEAEAK